MCATTGTATFRVRFFFTMTSSVSIGAAPPSGCGPTAASDSAPAPSAAAGAAASSMAESSAAADVASASCAIAKEFAFRCTACELQRIDVMLSAKSIADAAAMVVCCSGQ